MGTDVGDALDEVEHGEEQVLFGFRPHLQQIVLAEVAVCERQQIAFGVFIAELRNNLRGEIGKGLR